MKALLLSATLCLFVVGCPSESGDDPDERPLGPRGGTAASEDGKATLIIPEGALDKEEVITITSASAEGAFGSGVYDFGPSPMTFLKDVEICIERTAGMDLSSACLGYLEGGTWVCEDVCLKQSEEMLCGQTNHFTSFAILLSGGQGAKAACDDRLFGPAGGTLTLPDEAAALTVPEDALAEPVRITLSSSPVTSGLHGSATYDLTPAGQTFTRKVEVCLLPSAGVSLDAACLGYLDLAGRWQCEDRCPRQKDTRLCGETDHFTSFAILLQGGTGSACP